MSTSYSTTLFAMPDGLNIAVRQYERTSQAGEHMSSTTTAQKFPLLCLPGLTRNSADFHDLALAIRAERPVLAIDFRGRGESDRDPNWHNYVPPTYARDVVSILDQLSLERAVFCGTSLGGLVTMLIAAEHPERLAGAILNDIGPVIEADGLERIQQYTGQLPPVSSWDEAQQQVKDTYGAALPGLSDEDWAAMARRSFRLTEEGTPTLDFDPNIGRAIREVDMQLGDPWALFDSLQDIPTLVIRGALSDILSQQTVADMATRHAGLGAATIPERGHAPLLNEPDSVAAIRTFLQDLH